jgi:hypothetical protein
MASSSGGRPASALSALMSVFGVQDPTAPVAAGQPNQDCANFPSTPGHSVTAKGSAFNPSGKAGTVYAGEQPQNSKNPASVAQYDVACSKQPVK